jgi:hypothetical protein
MKNTKDTTDVIERIKEEINQQAVSCMGVPMQAAAPDDQKVVLLKVADVKELMSLVKNKWKFFRVEGPITSLQAPIVCLFVKAERSDGTYFVEQLQLIEDQLMGAKEIMKRFAKMLAYFEEYRTCSCKQLEDKMEFCESHPRTM